MYAVIETGGKQYKVQAGDTVDVELLGAESQASVELNRVLMVSSSNGVDIGTPNIEGATVQATVVDQVKGDKIVVFKYKSKNRYRVKTGHRQKYTRLKIDRIIVPGMVEEVPEDVQADEDSSIIDAPVVEVLGVDESGSDVSEVIEASESSEDEAVAVADDAQDDDAPAINDADSEEEDAEN